MDDTTRLDPAVLDTLRQLTPPGEPDVLTEVLTLFVSDFPVRMEKLRNAHAAGNIQEVQRAAHSLKGSAGNIGARRLFELCRQIEDSSKAGDLPAVTTRVDVLGQEFDRVEQEIRRLVPSSS